MTWRSPIRLRARITNAVALEAPSFSAVTVGGVSESGSWLVEARSGRKPWEVVESKGTRDEC